MPPTWHSSHISPSSSAPPPLPSPFSELHLHLSAFSVQTPHGPSSAFAVHINQPPITLTISHPIAGRDQTLNHAELHALLSALEVSWSLRVSRVAILTTCEYVAKAFNTNIDSWRKRSLRQQTGAGNGKSESGVGVGVQDVDIWQAVCELRDGLRSRGVGILVRQACSKTPNIGREASLRAARQSAGMNKWCNNCSTWLAFSVGHGRNCNGGVRVVEMEVFECRKDGCGVRGGKWEIGEHEKVYHGGMVETCKFCGGVFEDGGEQLHLGYCKRVPKCGICGVWFENFAKREEHVGVVHGYGYTE